MYKIINSNKMSTFKDIVYKKNDDETWAEWAKRVPNDEQDKLDYIEDFIYEYCEYGGPTSARLITDRLLGYGDASLVLSSVADLIPLLENTELLDAKIQDAYEAIRVKWQSEKVPRCHEKEEEDDDDYKQPVVTLTVAEMIAALSKLPPDAKLVMTESGFYSNSEFAEVMLPKLYTVKNDKFDCDLPTGTQVYTIGHSHQTY